MNLKCGIKDIVIRKRIKFPYFFHLKEIEPSERTFYIVRQGANETYQTKTRGVSLIILNPILL